MYWFHFLFSDKYSQTHLQRKYVSYSHGVVITVKICVVNLSFGTKNRFQNSLLSSWFRQFDCMTFSKTLHFYSIHKVFTNTFPDYTIWNLIMEESFLNYIFPAFHFLNFFQQGASDFSISDIKEKCERAQHKNCCAKTLRIYVKRVRMEVDHCWGEAVDFQR